MLSREVFAFCELVDNHFPRHFRVDQKLRATFSRALCVGMAHTLNLAVRRLQLSLTARVDLPSIPMAALLQPLPLVPRSRPVLRFASPEPRLIQNILHDRFAAILNGCLADSLESAEFLDVGQRGMYDSE